VATIERADVLVTAPGRNFVTLRITTSDGVTGLGDATLNGRELAVAGTPRPISTSRRDIWRRCANGSAPASPCCTTCITG
jgi:L-alanine-DL-glutamate epimerase-like enolase superfamily enzyme